MPVRYDIVGRLLRIEITGSFEPVELVTTYFDALADPDLHPQGVLLLDVRNSEFGQRPPEVTRVVTELFVRSAERVGGRCAIVVAQPRQEATARVAAGVAANEGVAIQVFEDEEAAQAWLGLAAPA